MILLLYSAANHSWGFINAVTYCTFIYDLQ